jgi:hypothetical protein
MDERGVANPVFSKCQPTIEQIAREMLDTSVRKQNQTEAPEMARLVRRDYGKALRKQLSNWEVRELLSEGKRSVWPALNKRAVKLVTPKEFTRHCTGLGLQLKFSSLSDEESLSLLGFYSRRADVGQKPLIWVNSAHHPAMVGAAIDHEMGHHVVSQMFALDRNTLQFLRRTSFEDHLTDSAELAADVLVSLAIFPRAAARELFKGHGTSSSILVQQIDFHRILKYVAVTYSLRFDKQLDGDKKFHVLAALIYFTKLRKALLDEYDI